MKHLLYCVQGQGIPLILVHGWGMGSSFLSSLAKSLSENYQVYLIDLPGYGDNSSSCPDDLDNFCEELAKALPSRAIWLGWSLGGLIAQNISCRYPERVLALITLSSSPAFMEKENWPGLKDKQLQLLFNQVQHNAKEAVTRFILWQFSILPSTRFLYKKIKDDFFASQNALLKGLHWLRETDLRADLNYVRCPTLMIFGKDDPLVPSKIQDLINPYFHKSILTEMLEASHIPFLSHKQQCLYLMRGFLNDL